MAIRNGPRRLATAPGGVSCSARARASRSPAARSAWCSRHWGIAWLRAARAGHARVGPERVRTDRLILEAIDWTRWSCFSPSSSRWPRPWYSGRRRRGSPQGRIRRKRSPDRRARWRVAGADGRCRRWSSHRIAVAVLLLSGALLLVQSVTHLQDARSGFDGTAVTFWVNAPVVALHPTRRAPAVVERILTRIRQVPGVADAAVNRCTPYGTPVARGRCSSWPGQSNASVRPADRRAPLRVGIVFPRARDRAQARPPHDRR